MYIIKSAVCSAFLLFSVLASFSQQLHVTGTITDAVTGNAIQSATIKVKSSGKVTITKSDGSFSLEATVNDVLQVSSVGYAPQSVDIDGREMVNIKLASSVEELGQIVMVGSRSSGRIKTESPVPVDVISLKQATQTTGKSDLTSLLNMMAPSFNYNKQSGGDGADAIDLATLRGLGPDQTLVLIDGKRQHQTAFVALFGTRGRGNSGTDLNAIPEAAIDHVEILRDGASAQYGSDAIAGVINIVLKKDINHFTVTSGVAAYDDHKYNALNSGDPSQYYTGSQLDGVAANLGLNYGVAIGKQGGFINFSGNFLSQGKTFREAPTSDSLPINTGRRAFGDASVISGGGVFNAEIPIANTKSKFYSFGMYNYKNSNAYAYTRNFSGNPARFPVNADGTVNYIPSIMHTSSDGTIFYDPIEDVHISDVSWGAGLKGEWPREWTWDVSNTIGYNNFHYYGEKTFNASQDTAGNITQTNFDDGGFSLLQNTTNLDFNKHFANVAQGFNLSFGAEERFEQYKIYQGEQASWDQYAQTPRPYSTGDTLTPASGAQGFPGFQPSDVVSATRTNFAVYVEGELNVTDKWLVDGAIRAENYSDFGGVSTYKFATRYKLTHNFNLRGSISTGFRAPSLQQIFFSNTETNVEDGVPTQVKIVPNANPIAKAAGIPDLQPEKSVNANIGFSWKPAKNITVTIDAYMVKIKNRVVLTGEFDTSDHAIAQALIDNNVDDAQFFANAVNTTNWGLDFVFEYKKHWGKNTFNALLAGNVQNLNIDKINIPAAFNDDPADQQTFYSIREQAFVKASAPPEKINLNLEYDVNKFGIGTHFTYFGKIVLYGYALSVPLDNNPSVYVPELFNYAGKMTTDLFASYKFTKNITGYIGADNIFNVHPDYGIVPGAKSQAYDGETGGPWDAVQMGYNGMRLFAKVALNF